MNYVLDVRSIRDAEKATMARGVTESFLRMNAALAICDFVCSSVNPKEGSVAVFCGTGGNGCDGLLATARLHKMGFAVTAYVVGDIGKIDKEIYSYAVNSGANIRAASEFKGSVMLIIDAIFGIGLNRPIEGETAKLIQMLNAAHSKRLAVDIPSGINADTGEVMGVAFKADVTITFSCYKLGMLTNIARNHCGKIVIADVGVNAMSDVQVTESADFTPIKRPVAMHKGEAGKVFVIGGCATMIGAPMLAGAAAHAAYLNGAGTVTVCLPKIHRAAASARATMAMMRFLSDTPDGFIKFDKSELDGIISAATAIDIGMGMGKTPDLKKIIEYICANFGGTLVIDADGINALADDYKVLCGAKCKIVLTPHVGEFTRLTGMPASVENARKLAKETGAVVALKSATTAITDGKTVRINLTGTPAMAKGGTGDVLGGCITALSCSFDPFDAAAIACYRNGLGAERAISSFAEMMLTPNEILRYADYDEN